MSISTSIKSRIAKPISAVVAVAATAAAFTFMAPAANAGVRWQLHAGTDYASAQAWPNGGTWARSEAWHGNRRAVSRWSNYATSAYADSGTSNYFGARVSW